MRDEISWEVLKLASQYLTEKQVTQPRLVAETILAHVLECKRMDLYLRFECPLEEREVERFRSGIKRAVRHEPVEYITGRVDFYGLSLAISPSVLIPRQETEILVDKAVEWMEEKGTFQGKMLWDVCCGSGCIGLSLKKKFPELSVFLSDASREALSVCQQGAWEADLDVSLFCGDLLDPFCGMQADYVFCNPPYLSHQEYEELDVSVKEYEPKGALLGGCSGLEFYERMAKQLSEYLRPGGQVFFEIGSTQGEMVSKIFSNSCWVRKELMQDYGGKDRFFFLEKE